MGTIRINGVDCPFEPGQTILQAANAAGVEIPQYCYHDGLSIVASCRICLGEIWAPNPRNEGRLEPYMGGKLMPTCQTPAADGMVVHTDSPKAVANQKAVMEYLLINHPLDCPVCDQAGECLLQDYSYTYGRGVSRFEETKVKQPKKDLGPHVLLYADRCIMCTRCVRFTREVSGTGELLVQGRGNQNEIDVFPGRALDNELASNVIDLCPVGALLDKDFLFAQRVWFLKSTPTIDGITASGDNIWADHNEGRIYRFRPRVNMEVNRWWITDEVRYGWKFVHSDRRLDEPMHRKWGALTPCAYPRAYRDAVDGLRGGKGRMAVVLSPMLTCEDAYALVRAARAIDERCEVVLGPVPRRGEDKVFPPGASRDDPKAFVMYAEKAPNARGVRRVAEALGDVMEFDAFLAAAAGGEFGRVLVTGNYPSAWATEDVLTGLKGAFVVVADTLGSDLSESADVVLPAATWLEKSGTFENARGMLQAFDRAIPPVGSARPEGQIAWDLLAVATGEDLEIPDRAELLVVDEGAGQVPDAVEVRQPRGRLFDPAEVRREMAGIGPLEVFASQVRRPEVARRTPAAMEVVEL